jgi:hypothetical protein
VRSTDDPRGLGIATGIVMGLAIGGTVYAGAFIASMNAQS